MSLHLPSRSKISIMRNVAAVFGLPCGTVTITECDSQVTHNNAGIWFKRHFSAAVVSTLIKSEHNGYVNQKRVHMFDDTNGIAKLDWCGYLLKCLREALEISASLVEYPWATNYSQWWRGKKQSHYATLAVEHTHQGSNIKVMSSTTILSLHVLKPHVVGSLSEATGYEGNPDNIRAMEQIVRDLQGQSIVADTPSFSLGLTQEQQGTGMSANPNNALDYATVSHQVRALILALPDFLSLYKGVQFVEISTQQKENSIPKL
nr:uncharacterized protein LOC109155364 [Ipomoea batatas]GMC97623.1 uncharacterized protein LOC109155364 [Ipomoea batatas]